MIKTTNTNTNNQHHMYEYRATILDWIDGDTVRVQLDLGFYCERVEKIRLARIDAHEMNSTSAYKQRMARSARFQARQLCPVGSVVTIATSKSHRDIYARYIGEVKIGRKNISDELLRRKVVKRYK